MGLNAGNILGIPITISPKKEILEYIEKSQKKTLLITTPNPEQCVLARRHPVFAKILKESDVAIPDGVGVAWALGVPRVPGVELFEDLVAYAAKKRVPIALIGGFGGVAVEAFECLSRSYTGLTGWAMEPEDAPIEEIAEKISKTGVGMIFVGLGAPKQEEYIKKLVNELRVAGYGLQKQNNKLVTRHSSLVNPLILMSVGGSFDVIAGRVPRAPVWMRTIGFEWAWRLACEPWRWRRQLALVEFIFLIIKDRLIS